MNRKLGTNGPLVSAVGLGSMGMSGAYEWEGGPADILKQYGLEGV